MIKTVFGDHEFADFESALTGNYPVREYVVQYQESDFAFVSRLMEEVGIYYFFKHTADSHTLVLVDDQVTHDPMPGYAEVPFYPPNTRGRHFAPSEPGRGQAILLHGRDGVIASLPASFSAGVDRQRSLRPQEPG